MIRLALGIALVWGVASFAKTSRTPHNWKLVWSDEFNIDGPADPSKWLFETGGDGWGNDDLEYYTLNNARVENGNLVIEARKEDYQDMHYTSARMYSKGEGWMFGRIEARAKLPQGAGTWPAIWMTSTENKWSSELWPDNGEVDFMEHVGREPTLLYGNFYTKNFNWMNDNGKTEIVELPDLESEYHVYAVEWDEEKITLSIDGRDYNSFPNPHTNWQDWPFDQHYKVTMNFAVGGFGGDVTDETIFPQRLLVDYVRVYQPVVPRFLVMLK